MPLIFLSFNFISQYNGKQEEIPAGWTTHAEDQVCQVIRYHHYAYLTEKTYSGWIRRYIRQFGAKFHPKDMGKTEVEAFFSHLAVKENVSASTQRQALNALFDGMHTVESSRH